MSILDLMGFKKAVEVARAAQGAKTVPRLVEWIDRDRVKNDRDQALVNGDPFEAGQCYFSLRLSGLHLRNARRFTTDILPLCICLAEFNVGGRTQTVPFAL